MDKLGKHFIVGLESTVLSDYEKNAIRSLKPSGFIIFKRNIDPCANWTNKLKDLIKSLYDVSETDSLIISIDHEGGLVHRLKDPVTHFPKPRKWASYSGYVGDIMGKELSSLGFNLNYAPLCDIDTCKENPVIGERSFADCEEEVTFKVLEFMETQESWGVLSCAKHFPGHGGTTKDSHFELPIVNYSKEEIYEREIAPFKAMIEKDVKIIMTAHVIYKHLDPQFPATLSSKIIYDLLRSKLGYSNLVVTDALEMLALREFYQNLDKKLMLSSRNSELDHILFACTGALNAGVDLLMLATSYKNMSPLKMAFKTFEGLKDSYACGTQFLDLLNDSAIRIENLITCFKKKV